jgi:hypothetical protein
MRACSVLGSNRCWRRLVGNEWRGKSFSRIVATPGALAALEASGEVPVEYLARHIAGDWGDVDEHDRRENELSLIHGFRLLSAYTLNSGTKIWIITEADRSVTTVLLPEEY